MIYPSLSVSKPRHAQIPKIRIAVGYCGDRPPSPKGTRRLLDIYRVPVYNLVAFETSCSEAMAIRGYTL